MKADPLLNLTGLISNKPGTVLLYSGGTHSCSNTSYLAFDPIETIACRDWAELKAQLTPGYFWFGYLTYEFGVETATHTQTLYPASCFYRPAIVLSSKHGELEVLHCENSHKDRLEQLLKETAKKIAAGPFQQTKAIEPFETYEKQISKIKELILDGEVYQLNYSHEMEFQGAHDPFALFQELIAKNPSPFSAYVSNENANFICTSPERLLKFADGRLETRPIKGTMPRGKTLEEDESNLKHLKSSPKELSELLMITDLARNDLSKVSHPGTVKVDEIFKAESYTNVHHLISVVRSKPKDLHPLDLLKACFPGGSITGCPKLSAMQAIYELEQRPRGIYTGSIGYFAPDGTFDFNIAIRTAVSRQDTLTLALGGGIVIDSTAEKEYAETLHKGQTFLETIKNNKI